MKDVDAEIQKTGNELFIRDYRLGCEDEKPGDNRPVHPSCIDPNGECGCGRG